MSATPLNSALFRLHRVFFLAYAVFTVGSFASVIITGDVFGIVFGLLIALFGLAHWFGARGAKEGKTYGRIISRAFGTVWLIGIPIGTILGIYVLSKTSEANWTSA